MPRPLQGAATEVFMVRLAARDDVDQLAGKFARDGYVQLASFLEDEDATALHQLLRGRSDWKQVLTTSSGYVELDRPTRAAMGQAQLQALDAAVYAQARTGFQYRYESIRVPDPAAERASSDDLLTKLATTMSSDPARALLRRITGSTDISYADAQATAFAPGDFLTGHDDEIEGKQRRAAYVLNLTPSWRIEWGGLLLFHGADGHV
jgi:SM-20-related protein